MPLVLGMGKLLTIISVILLIAGLVFVGQGSGYFRTRLRAS